MFETWMWSVTVAVAYESANAHPAVVISQTHTWQRKPMPEADARFIFKQMMISKTCTTQLKTCLQTCTKQFQSCFHTACLEMMVMAVCRFRKRFRAFNIISEKSILL